MEVKIFTEWLLLSKLLDQLASTKQICFRAAVVTFLMANQSTFFCEEKFSVKATFHSKFIPL